MSQLSKRDMLETILLYYLFWKVKMARRVTKVVRHIHAPAKAFQTSDLTGASIADLGTRDHDLLTGLGDDDHTQYVPTDGVARQLADAGYPNALLTDGSRQITDNLVFNVVAGASKGIKFSRASPNDCWLVEAGSGGQMLMLRNHAGTAWRNFGIKNLTVYGGIVQSPSGFDCTFSSGAELYIRATDNVAAAVEILSYDGSSRQTVFSCVGGDANIPRAGDITMQDQRMMQFGTYTDAQRPAAGTAGRWIFNTDDGMPNYDDGTDWRDINGNIT